MKFKCGTVILVASLVVLSGTGTAQTNDTTSEAVRVVDMKLCRAIRNRAVEDEDSTFALNSNVFLWVQTSGGVNNRISVTWKNGAYSHSTLLTIGRSRWRTWASKVVRMPGEWSVTVTDEKDSVLKEKS